MENTIDISNVDLKQFVKDVYELSSPQGFGFLHFKQEGLTDEEIDDILLNSSSRKNTIYMDYIHGRACKMTIFEKNGKRLIYTPWYDHTDDQLKELLNRHNIEYNLKEEHGSSCACIRCKQKRRPEN